MRRAVGAVALAGLAILFLGCMSLTIADRSVLSCSDDGVFSQEGTFDLGTEQQRTIYYPIPFGSPPNLVLSDLFQQSAEAEILAQKEDHFIVRSKVHVTDLRWKARGVRKPMPPATPPEVVPPPELPERPVPVEKPSNG